MSHKRVLVLGASGFLGCDVFEKLKAGSFEKVLGTCFNQRHYEDLLYLDVYDAESVKALFIDFKPHVIVWCLMDMSNEVELTTIGLKNVLENSPHRSRVIYISTDGFKGGSGNYSEEVMMPYWDKSHAGSGYVNGKLVAEKMVLERGNSAVVRTGPIYGQNALGKWDKRISRLMDSCDRGERVTFSDNLYKTFVHVTDLADLIIEIIDREFTGLIHVGPVKKENYYSFHLKIARDLGLQEALITANTLSAEDVIAKGLVLDTSMNTSKCRRLFRTYFRELS